MTSSAQDLTIEVATQRLLRIAALFGLTASLVAVVTAVQQASSGMTVVLAAAWTIAWASAGAQPGFLGYVLRHWRRTTVLAAGLSTATILASGGFDSLLKTEANWLAWAAPVLLGTTAALAVGAILSAGLLTAFLLDGMSLAEILSGPERYTAVTDILNPLVIVLVALAVTGVFRLVLTTAALRLQRARDGEATSSPAMAALLAAPPTLVLPAGHGEAVQDAVSTPLSPAERDIVSRLARGQTPQQIALARGVRDDTVYNQIGSAKQKAGARTIEHLVARVWRPPT